MNPAAQQLGRPLTDSTPATGHIHLRVTLARKGWYVRMARLHNLTLAEWMQRVCDEGSGYPPKSQLVTANKTTDMKPAESIPLCKKCKTPMSPSGVRC
jgi:hypothetical protein